MVAWRTLIAVTVVGAALAVALIVSSCRNGGGSGAAGRVTVTIKGRPFALEVAADPASIEKGLMHRATIPDGTGMIFIFPDAQVRGFWMKNCLTDIDVIFLDPAGRVTATHRMVTEPPQRADESDAAYAQRLPTYSSRWPAQFAIELPPGTLDQLNIEFEEKIELDLPRLKALAR